MFENGWQRLIVVVALIGLLAVLADAVAALGDENAKSLGHWVDGHWLEIGKTVGAALPAVATYLFGRRAGRKVAKTEAYSSAIGTAEAWPQEHRWPRICASKRVTTI